MLLYVDDASATTNQRLARYDDVLTRLAHSSWQAGVASSGGASVRVVVDEATFSLPLEGVIDLAAERARLEKGIAAAAKERDALAKRLDNPAFVEKAKPDAVAKARDDHAAKTAEAEQLGAALARLG